MSMPRIHNNRIYLSKPYDARTVVFFVVNGHERVTPYKLVMVKYKTYSATNEVTKYAYRGL